MLTALEVEFITTIQIRCYVIFKKKQRMVIKILLSFVKVVFRHHSLVLVLMQ